MQGWAEEAPHPGEIAPLVLGLEEEEIRNPGFGAPCTVAGEGEKVWTPSGPSRGHLTSAKSLLPGCGEEPRQPPLSTGHCTAQVEGCSRSVCRGSRRTQHHCYFLQPCGTSRLVAGPSLCTVDLLPVCWSQAPRQPSRVAEAPGGGTTPNREALLPTKGRNAAQGSLCKVKESAFYPWTLFLLQPHPKWKEENLQRAWESRTDSFLSFIVKKSPGL